MQDKDYFNNDLSTENNSDPLYSYNYIQQDNQDTFSYDTEGYQQFDQGPEKNNKKERKNGLRTKLIKCAAMGLVFGLVSGTVFHGTGFLFDYAKGDSTALVEETKVEEKQTQAKDSTKDVIPVTNVSKQVTDVSDIVDLVMPSIVSITNLSEVEQMNQFDPFFGGRYGTETVPQENRGSGIIIDRTDEEILIVTNNHVVSNAKTISVTFDDEEVVDAQVKGTDSYSDLAVLSIPIKNIKEDTLNHIKVSALGDSDEIKVGQSAIAIGNALGYGQSVTTGVISALNREVSTQDVDTQQITTNELIQTDAAINPGNSGGALLNLNGEVIGINSVKYSDTDVEGMGYAIPMASAKPIIDHIINGTDIPESEQAFLGISGVDVAEEDSERYNMPIGVYIGNVTDGSAADKGGLMQGDIITKFNGKEIKAMSKLQNELKYLKAGEKVELTVKRAENGDYKEHDLTITLGKKG